MAEQIKKRFKSIKSFDDGANQLNLLLQKKISFGSKLQPGQCLNDRVTFVSNLKTFYNDCKSIIESILEFDPFLAPQAIGYYSKVTDKIIVTAVTNVIKFVHPIASPTNSEKICVIAVGGYGRKEMAPFSDIDLLFVTPYKQTAWGESVIETILYILWDLKMKIGYSVRTVDDCIRLGKLDTTIRTTLLEHRYLAGERSLQLNLEKKLWKELFSKSGSEFIEAKLEERVRRHWRQGGARYMLEPNVKEGKGGLRDLQTLYWITKYLYKTKSKEEQNGPIQT